MYRLTTEAGIPLIPERLHDTKKKKGGIKDVRIYLCLRHRWKSADADQAKETCRTTVTDRARIFRQVPFTIQLTYKNEPVLQPVTIAEDPGRSNIGMAVVSLSGELLSAAVVQTRNKEIVKLMEKRKQHRRASRNGERKAR